MAESEVRSVLIPITGTDLLLPNATIAEIVAYSRPEEIEQAPEWLLGNVLWHGWQVPVVALGVLTEKHDREPLDGAKICITKSLIGNRRMPYVGILAQGFPRLVTVTETGMTEVPESASHLALAGQVIIGDREAWVPDLDRISQLVAHAAFGALPLTS